MHKSETQKRIPNWFNRNDKKHMVLTRRDPKNLTQTNNVAVSQARTRRVLGARSVGARCVLGACSAQSVRTRRIPGWRVLGALGACACFVHTRRVLSAHSASYSAHPAYLVRTRRVLGAYSVRTRHILGVCSAHTRRVLGAFGACSVRSRWSRRGKF